MSLPSARTIQVGFALALALSLEGCGGGSLLEGSVETVARLDFATVEAEWVMDSLVIRYLSEGGDEPARLTAPRQEALNQPEVTWPALRLERYVVSRAPDGQLSQEPQFPTPATGYLRFRRLGENAGERASGVFAFQLEGGYTLSGEFDTALMDAGR